MNFGGNGKINFGFSCILFWGKIMTPTIDKFLHHQFHWSINGLLNLVVVAQARVGPTVFDAQLRFLHPQKLKIVLDNGVGRSVN